MTEQELRKLVVDLALRYEGIVQGSPEHHLLIDAYNSWFAGHYPDNWKAKYTDSWCMEAVDAWAIMARVISVVPNACDTKSAVNIAKSRGEWHDRSYTPQPADLIFFDWDNDGLANHVGYVVSATSTAIVTIEGNSKNNECRSNTVAVGDNRILGFCTPDYASLVVEPVPDKPDYATDYDAEKAGQYAATTGLYIRKKPTGISRALGVIPKGGIASADGWYATNGSTVWLYVNYNGIVGFSSAKFLKKV